MGFNVEQKKKIFSEFFPPPSHMYNYGSRQCVYARTIALAGERALCGARDVYIIHKRVRAGISRAVVANAHASSFLSHASLFLSLERWVNGSGPSISDRCAIGDGTRSHRRSHHQRRSRQDSRSPLFTSATVRRHPSTRNRVQQCWRTGPARPIG